MSACVFVCAQQGLRTLQDLAPEMRLAMACDLEEDEMIDVETTGDEVFESEPGTSVTTTPASTPMPPADMLDEQITVFMEPEPHFTSGGVITEQVRGRPESQRPECVLSASGVVMEQPVKSEPPARWVSVCVCYIRKYGFVRLNIESCIIYLFKWICQFQCFRLKTFSWSMEICFEREINKSYSHLSQLYMPIHSPTNQARCTVFNLNRNNEHCSRLMIPHKIR